MQLAMTIKRVTTTFLVKGGRAGGGAAKQPTSARRAQAPHPLEDAAEVGDLRGALRIAIFHRCATMPTFPNRYAACSGSMEAGETPWETAQRELQEETNFSKDYQVLPIATLHSVEAGLYVDVDFVSPRSGKSSIIRVYPFVIHVVDDFELALKGTEHDDFRWMSLEEVEDLDQQSKTVPSLALAFHHATAGQYDNNVTKEERQWASDKANGASTLSRNALHLLMEVNTADPGRLAMLRPSMVTIVNCMNAVQRLSSSERQTQQSKVLLSRRDAAKEVLEDLERETTRSVTHAVDCILQLYRDNNQQPLAMGTFSRSSTLGAILNQVLDHHPHVLQLPILCSRSIPGGEGELMAKDLNARIGDMVERAVCVDDDEMMGKLVNLDVLLIGADCILADHSAVINKVGSASLASAVSENRKKSTGKKCHVLCCTDRFKVWDDLFPPPLEEDLFELIPVANHIDQILLPPDEST